VGYVTINEFETRLQWHDGSVALLSGEKAPSIALGAEKEGLWNPESLLVGAVEGRTLLAFMEQARTAGIEILFYQSSAMARRVEGPDGKSHYTDLIVRPHVAVRDKVEAEAVWGIFARLPECCFPGSILRLTPRIVPVVDIWGAERVEALGRPGPCRGSVSTR
jgi:organic hydroperoxide reductase OsmC/OhrA